MEQKFTISFMDGKDFETYNTMLTLMRYWCKGEKTENKPIIKISKNRRKNKKWNFLKKLVLNKKKNSIILNKNLEIIGE